MWETEIFPGGGSYAPVLNKEEMEQRLIDVLKASAKKIGVLTPTVSTAIQGAGTLCKYMELPPLSKKELEFAVPSEARKFIPFPMDQVVLSYITVPQVSTGGKKTGIFFAAAHISNVDYIKDLMNKAGIEITGLEVPILPLMREFSKNHDVPGNQFFMLINVGFRITHVVISHGGYPYFVREFPLAGRDFTYAFQMGSQSSWAAAEDYKKEYDVNRGEIQLNPFISNWENEIKSSLEFFMKQFKNISPEIKHVYLSGGSAGLKGLDTRLSGYLNIPVTVDGLDKLRWKGKGDPPENIYAYNTAIGLALES
ncbi:MAG: pilus assembly protein PilM [Chloroflexi bacterium]|nr:pilus assembly protein PilM [Chloroflexota bacterium]